MSGHFRAPAVYCPDCSHMMCTKFEVDPRQRVVYCCSSDCKSYGVRYEQPTVPIDLKPYLDPAFDRELTGGL
jgi:hypothetical protein